MTQLERLIQEHAIYKAFFEDYVDRPMNEPDKPFIHTLMLLKANAFNVIMALKKLDNGTVYCNPIWANADKTLFTIDIESLKTDTEYTGIHVGKKIIEDIKSSKSESTGVSIV